MMFLCTLDLAGTWSVEQKEIMPACLSVEEHMDHHTIGEIIPFISLAYFLQQILQLGIQVQ